MATKTWNGATADWYTDADWIPSGVPVAGDDVIIPTGTVFLQGSDPPVADERAPHNITIGSAGTLQLTGTATMTVTGDFANAGVLDVDIAQLDGGGSLTITGTLSNTKTVQVGSAFLNASAANSLTVGALSNASGATFQIFGSSGQEATLAFTGAGFTQNDGLFGLTNITSLTLNNSFTNSATGTFGLGRMAPVTVTGDFANAGVLDVDIAQLDGGGSLTITGTLSNTKTVQVG